MTSQGWLSYKSSSQIEACFFSLAPYSVGVKIKAAQQKQNATSTCANNTDCGVNSRQYYCPTHCRTDGRLTISTDAACKKPNHKRCNGVCVNTLTDPKHCGRCTRKCASGGSCINGSCFNPGPKKCKKVGTCGQFKGCGPGDTCACVTEYQSDDLFCQDLSGICTACASSDNCTAAPGGVCCLRRDVSGPLLTLLFI